MILLYSLAGTCVAFALATAFFRNKSMEKPRLVTKLTASLLFCVVGLIAASQREEMTISAALLLGALLLGLVGDIMLGIDPFVKEDARKFAFLLGGVPFFLGHMLYIALLLPIGAFEPGVLLILPVVPVLFLMLHKTKLVDFGRDLGMLMIYGSFLSAMMMCTVNVARQGAGIPQGEALSRLMLLPGVFFVFSDTALFMGRYGSAKLRRFAPMLSYCVMLTYYAAQAMFALAVKFI